MMCRISKIHSNMEVSSVSVYRGSTDLIESYVMSGVHVPDMHTKTNSGTYDSIRINEVSEQESNTNPTISSPIAQAS